jgi:hypothetical protein
MNSTKWKMTATGNPCKCCRSLQTKVVMKSQAKAVDMEWTQQVSFEDEEVTGVTEVAVADSAQPHWPDTVF